MESAFGVEHAGVSKGVPKGLLRVAARGTTPNGVLKPNPSKQTLYAHERLQAHKQGRLSAQRNPHTMEGERTKGVTARRFSRGYARELTGRT
jgi:hypothetical protein